MVNSSAFFPIYIHPKFTVMVLFRAGQFVYFIGSKSPSKEINDIHTYKGLLMKIMLQYNFICKTYRVSHHFQNRSWDGDVTGY